MQSEHLIYAISLSYLIGSIPFGLILTKIFAKKDIQSSGSGNIGATNVVRVAGKKIGYATFILDSLKGVAGILLAYYFSLQNPLFAYICGLFAILGHMFPIWLKFNGGKGVATFIGILFCYDIFLTICFLLSWYFIYYITRIVSLASIILMLVVIMFFIIKWKYVSGIFIITALLVIIKHHQNIYRLIKGQESSFKNSK